jgi:hypothetical protein
LDSDLVVLKCVSSELSAEGEEDLLCVFGSDSGLVIDTDEPSWLYPAVFRP